MISDGNVIRLPTENPNSAPRKQGDAAEIWQRSHCHVVASDLLAKDLDPACRIKQAHPICRDSSTGPP